jgi:cytochrome c biogenesis protein CcdA
MIGKGERLFAFVFGLFLVGVGLYALLFSQTSMAWRVGGGAALILLGGNMLQSSWKGKPSWLSRIGPLP